MVKIAQTAVIVTLSVALASAQFAIDPSKIPADCSTQCTTITGIYDANSNCLKEASCYCSAYFTSNLMPCAQCVHDKAPDALGGTAPEKVVEQIVVACANAGTAAAQTSISTAKPTNTTASGSSTGTGTSTGATPTPSSGANANVLSQNVLAVLAVVGFCSITLV